jgi:hypothetical protein
MRDDMYANSAGSSSGAAVSTDASVSNGAHRMLARDELHKSAAALSCRLLSALKRVLTTRRPEREVDGIRLTAQVRAPAVIRWAPPKIGLSPPKIAGRLPKTVGPCRK